MHTPAYVSAGTRLTRPWPTTASNPLRIALGVALLHASALWALHTGLLARVADTLVPVLLLQASTAPDTLSSPKPVAPQAPQAKLRAAPHQPLAPSPAAIPPAPSPAPAPVVPTAMPTEHAPTAAASPASTGSANPLVATAPVLANGPALASTTAPARPSTPLPAALELPSSEADYLRNPKPLYPRLSRQLREEGRVMVRVYISTEGLPEKVELAQSSGYFRLDQAALDAVAQWRFVPGKRNGVPEAMSYLVPIPFIVR